MKYKFKPSEEWIEEFWNRVDKSSGAEGCWEWIAGKHVRGYGCIVCHGRAVLAHRASFFLSGRRVTARRPCVLHSCHNTGCVNPRHLRAGSQNDNMQDMVNAGRCGAWAKPWARPTGENHGMAKLTKAEVRKIRSIYKTGVPQRELARRYGVSQTLISLIVRHKIWGAPINATAKNNTTTTTTTA